MDQYEIVEMIVKKNQMMTLPVTESNPVSKVLVILEGKMENLEVQTPIETGDYVVISGEDVASKICAIETTKLLMISSKTKGKVQAHALDDYQQTSARIKYGKKIAKEILNGSVVNQVNIDGLLETLGSHDPFEGDLFNQYSDLFMSIFSELPLEPLKLSKTYCSRLGAKWVMNAPSVREGLTQVTQFIEKAYREIFLPHIDTPLVRQAVYWVLFNNGERKTVQYVAECLFTNRTHLSERFKQLVGISLSSYILRVKMYGAMLLLMDKSLDVSDILEILGYKDESHFAKTFRSFSGITPNEFVKRYTQYQYYD